jgi:4-hydroxy-tetrahydrodipicolinate synthase
LWAAATTPINATGTIDHAALGRHAKRLLDRGGDGVVLYGGCGDGPSFSIAERLSAAEAVLAGGIAPERLALSAGCSAIADAADGARVAALLDELEHRA